MTLIKKPENAIEEVIEKRTLHSKTFRMPDGKFKYILSSKPIQYFDCKLNCYKDINPVLKLDTNTQTYVADELPYVFKLNSNGIGFSYNSKKDGFINVSLYKIEDSLFDNSRKYNFVVEGSKIIFSEVEKDLDIVFKVSEYGVKTFRILKSKKAPKSFSWYINYEDSMKEKLSRQVIGLDNLNNLYRGENRTRRFCDIKVEEFEINKNEVIIKDVWSGLVKFRNPLTRILSLSDDVIYPVEIDPDITEKVPDTNNDGYEYGTTWQTGAISGENLIGKFYGQQVKPGWRFTTVAIPTGATIDLANLKLNVIGKFSSYGGGTIFGYDTDDSVVWSSTIKPSTVAKTTASTSLTRPVATGIHTFNVTSIIQEIVDRAGWASGNDISLLATTYETAYTRATKFEDFSNAGTNEAVLEIDYTEASSGLTINVNDSITIVESIISNNSSLGSLNVNDVITLSENLVIVKVYCISVNESISIVENINCKINQNINVNDSINVTENIVLLNSLVNVSILDSVSTFESISLVLSDLSINIFDSITLLESLSVVLTSFININDAIITVEGLTTIIDQNINVFDIVSLTESFSVSNLLDSAIVLESISLTENVNVSISETGTLNILVNDIISLNENITIVENIGFINVADSIILIENVLNLITYFISVSDANIVNESVNTNLVSFISCEDDISVSENFIIYSDININKDDSLTIIESSNVFSDLNFSVSDIVVTEENILIANSNLGNINIFSAISLEESIIADIPGISRDINVNDSIAILEDKTIFKDAVTFYLKKLNSKVNNTIKINSKI